MRVGVGVCVMCGITRGDHQSAAEREIMAVAWRAPRAAEVHALSVDTIHSLSVKKQKSNILWELCAHSPQTKFTALTIRK